MFHLPQNALSLVSLFLFFFFYQGGLFFIYFYYGVRRLKEGRSREYLFFGLMSFMQALYSFGAWQLYSANDLRVGAFWERFQWFAAILLFVFFMHFSWHYLKLRRRFLFFTVDLPAAFFVLLSLFWPRFLSEVPAVKTFSIMGNVYRIPEVEAGLLADVAGLWLGLYLIFMIGLWFFLLYRRKLPHTPSLAAVGLIFFILTALNELFVAMGFYRSPYLLEYGFFFFSVAFYFQFLLDFLRLYKANLLRAQEIARLNEESRFFINTVAHDLKAPLLSIEGFATLLQEGNPHESEKTQDYLKRITVNASQMMQRLGELKNFINIGILHEEKEEIVVRDLVQQVLADFELPLRNFEVSLKIGDPLEVRFSRRRLYDVFANLVDNAVKFSKDRENLRLEIEAFPEEREWLFKIEDNGPGIDPVYHEQIFEPFFRADQQTLGSGIGLAAAKKIVTQAGGRIWVESEPGRGCRFFFTLPRS